MATKTKTETGAKAETKKEVTSHPQLVVLLQQEDAAKEKAASVFVEMGELVKREHISRPVLIKSIMEARGIKQESAESQATRLMNLLKNPETMKAIRKGDITVRAAVAGSSKRVPKKSNKTKNWQSALDKLVSAAKALGQDKESILSAVKAALDKAGVK